MMIGPAVSEERCDKKRRKEKNNKKNQTAIAGMQQQKIPPIPITVKPIQHNTIDYIAKIFMNSVKMPLFNSPVQCYFHDIPYHSHGTISMCHTIQKATKYSSSARIVVLQSKTSKVRPFKCCIPVLNPFSYLTERLQQTQWHLTLTCSLQQTTADKDIGKTL